MIEIGTIQKAVKLEPFPGEPPGLAKERWQIYAKVTGDKEYLYFILTEDVRRIPRERAVYLQYFPNGKHNKPKHVEVKVKNEKALFNKVVNMCMKDAYKIK